MLSGITSMININERRIMTSANGKKELSMRKNITMPVEIENDLKLLSEKMNKTQSAIIQELIEEKAEEFKKIKKITAFKKSVGIAAGLIGGETMQKIKSQKG